MEIILKKDVKHLGYKDDMVKVKNGYALNYLIPTGSAMVATESNKKVLAETKKQRAYKEDKIRKAAQSVADGLKDITVKVGAKAGENGKIFGSVTPVQVAEAIKKLGYDIDRKSIVIDGDAIKSLGKYTATIRLHREISVPVALEVVED
jgi:large subunit ribosomal protein L9